MRTPQDPIGSGFGAASTAAEVIAGRDLTGKTAVVTGGYSGIGVETVRAFSVHQGGIATDLIRHMSQAEIDASQIIDKNGKPIIDPKNNLKTPQQGAATSVWCATSPQLNGMGGVYCQDCDLVAAGRLWHLSEQLTGVGID